MATAKKRAAKIKRETKETQISVDLNLDGAGKVKVETPYGFLTHMVTSMAKHGLFDLTAQVKGDIEVDAHHTVEDFGLVLGEAMLKAAGDKHGIVRFGQAMVPMDDALATAVVDFSGRPYFVYQVEIPARDQWDFDLNLVREFFLALANSARINLHLRLNYGVNYHHASEALFKAAGRALGQALGQDPRVKGVPSTKGSL